MKRHNKTKPTRSVKFSRGYKEARQCTNSYLGNYHPRTYCEMDAVEEAYNDYIQSEYLGG